MNNVHVWKWVSSAESGNKVTTTTTTDTVTSQTCYNNSDGTTGSATIYKVARSGPSTTQNYTLNMAQDVLNNANTTTFMTMVTSLQTGNESTYGAGYRDPNEPSSPNISTDVVFDAAVNTIYGLFHTADDYHDDVLAAYDASTNTDGYRDGVAHTYGGDYAAFLAGVTVFQAALKLRITEISNRIGYLNGKGSQSSGIADGGSGLQSTSGTNTVTTANYGFLGTSFNGGNGYANTIYSHANFLAGKKINLIGKVLKAILGVQVMYDEVEKKRSEYYEYNQAE